MHITIVNKFNNNLLQVKYEVGRFMTVSHKIRITYRKDRSMPYGTSVAS